MTYEQYWYGDPRLRSAYREAERLRRQRAEFDAWMSGIYQYNAMLVVEAKRSAETPQEADQFSYPESPFGLFDLPKTPEQIRREKEEEVQRQREALVKLLGGEI